jgi:hypothetical protein
MNKNIGSFVMDNHFGFLILVAVAAFAGGIALRGMTDANGWSTNTG